MKHGFNVVKLKKSLLFFICFSLFLTGCGDTTILSYKNSNLPSATPTFVGSVQIGNFTSASANPASSPNSQTLQIIPSLDKGDKKEFFRELYTLSKNSTITAPITALAFSTNGTLLIIGRLDGSLELFDVATRKEIFSQKLTQGHITALAFEPDDKAVFVGTVDNGNVSIVDVASAKVIKVLSLPLKNVEALSFSSDGRLLIIRGVYPNCGCGPGLLIWLWGENKEVFKSFSAADFQVSTAVFNPNNQTVVYGSLDTSPENSSIHIWSSAGITMPSLVGDLPGEISNTNTLTFNKNGTLLAVSRTLRDESSLELIVWSWKTGQIIFKNDQLFTSDADFPTTIEVSFTPDDKYLIASSIFSIKVWDLTTQQLAFVATDQQAKGLSNTAFSKDGLYLAAGYKDGIVRIFGK